MPIQRFKSSEEAREALWVLPGDPHLIPRIRKLWDFAARLAPGAAPRGVRKFRSVEDAQRDRAEWVAQRAHILRATRREV